jgi:hypothetical protein
MRRLLCVLLVTLAACAAPVQQERKDVLSPLPAASYREAAKRGAAVYEIDASKSLLLIRTGREGPARRLGHDHAIGSESLQGFLEIAADDRDSRGDLGFPVRSLVVDKPEYRDHFKLDTEPSAADIQGTYDNMLRVLEPDRHPWITARVRVASRRGKALELAVSITLHGTTSEYRIPVTLQVDSERLHAEARLDITHSEFGLEPFSAMGGLLRVADVLQVELKLVAARLRP